MGKSRIVHYFDVEDVFFGNKYNVHGIPKWLAEILTEEGVVGTFNITGKKIESLVKDGRYDVIEKLRNHEIGNHTMNGSFQPAMPEYLSDKDWAGGIEAIQKNEMGCFDLIEKVFGKEAYHFHQHFDCISAQAFSAFGKYGKVVSSAIGYVHDFYPGHAVAWYCGNLSFSIDRNCSFPQYYYEGKFKNGFGAWEERIRELSGDVDFFTIFGSHPFELISTIYTDRFCSVNGKNLPPEKFGLWGTPELRSASELEEVKKVYRMAVRAMTRQNCAELSSFKELARLYGAQKKFISQADLEPFCCDVMEKWQIAVGRYFSPAELLVALCRIAVDYKTGGPVADSLRRYPVLGPLQFPVGWPEMPELEPDFICLKAGEILNTATCTGHLPANVSDGEREIGIGHFLRGICSFYLDIISGRRPGKVKMWEPFFRYKQRIMPQWPIQDIKLWNTHFLRSPEFNPFNLYKFQRLMNWTLKPADTMEHFKKENIEVEENYFI